LDAISSYTGLVFANSKAIFNLHRQCNAPSVTHYSILTLPPKDLHIETIKSHPRRPIRLTQISPSRQWLRPIESTDIVQTEEPALKNIVAALIFPVDPPGEIEQQFLEHPFQEGQVCISGEFALDLEYSERCPVLLENSNVK
jgi:hypothetical protein